MNKQTSFTEVKMNDISNVIEMKTKKETIMTYYENQTTSVAKEIIDSAGRSKWFDDEPYYSGTKTWFEHDPKEQISSKYIIMTNASRKKVLDRFLELLTSLNATYDEPYISYEVKYRTKKIYDNGRINRFFASHDASTLQECLFL